MPLTKETKPNQAIEFTITELKSLKSIQRIQLGMMYTTFNGDSCIITIIPCYSPTNASDEKETTTFYNALSSLVQHIPNHNVLIIPEDMYVQKDKDRNNKQKYLIFSRFFT